MYLQVYSRPSLDLGVFLPCAGVRLVLVSHPWPCTLHSLWCMPEFPMARANVLQEQSFKLAQQKLCWALAVVLQEGGNMVQGRRRVARGRYSLLDTSDVKLVRWAQLRLQVLVVLTLVAASSWAKPPLEFMLCISRAEVTVCFRLSSPWLVLPQNLVSSRMGTAIQAFFLQPQAKSFKWSLSLLRASGVLKGVCQILWWEVDPKSHAGSSGARPKSLIQLLGTDIITHMKHLYYATDCMTNLALYVWSKFLCFA